MTPRECADLVRALYDCFNLRDLDRIDAIADSGAHVELLPFDQRYGLRELYELTWYAFPDALVELVQLDAGDNHATAETLLRGTHRGMLFLPVGRFRPTQRAIEVPIVETFSFDEAQGRIASAMTGFEKEELFHQLGITPLPLRPRWKEEAPEVNWGY